MASILIRILSYFASGLIFRMLSGIGLSVFTAYGLNTVFDNYITLAYQNMNGFSPMVMAFVGLAGLDQAISILVGALTFTIYLKSLSLIFTRSA
ncbi:hypothetical protein MWMV18_MWMV18_03587 [Acinetobacter calcoaceticus]|nr:hypothetical protein MWMV18_MWMV18_03587 [Acinetobacter calcoaceticus]